MFLFIGRVVSAECDGEDPQLWTIAPTRRKGCRRPRLLCRKIFFQCRRDKNDDRSGGTAVYHPATHTSLGQLKNVLLPELPATAILHRIFLDTSVCFPFCTLIAYPARWGRELADHKSPTDSVVAWVSQSVGCEVIFRAFLGISPATVCGIRDIIPWSRDEHELPFSHKRLPHKNEDIPLPPP